MKQPQTRRLNMIRLTFIRVVQPVGTRQAGTCCREGYYGLSVPPPEVRSTPDSRSSGSSLLATSCFSTHFPGTWEMGISYGRSEVLQAEVKVGPFVPGYSCPGSSTSLENDRVPGWQGAETGAGVFLEGSHLVCHGAGRLMVLKELILNF